MSKRIKLYWVTTIITVFAIYINFPLITNAVNVYNVLISIVALLIWMFTIAVTFIHSKNINVLFLIWSVLIGLPMISIFLIYEIDFETFSFLFPVLLPLGAFLGIPVIIINYTYQSSLPFFLPFALLWIATLAAYIFFKQKHEKTSHV